MNQPGPSRDWRVVAATTFMGIARRLSRLGKMLSIIRAAVPVGLLTESGVEAVVSAAYQRAPDFYDPNRYQLRYEQELLPILEGLGVPPAGRVLDLYSGHGREAEIFAKAGYEVLAVEGLSEVAERAMKYSSQAGFEAEFLVADIDDWMPDRPSDVVYTSLWMYSTVPGRQRRVDWLRRILSWAADDGVVIISITPRRGRSAELTWRLARVLGRLSRNPRIIELGDRFSSSLFWHDFAPDEVATELREAGATVVATHDVKGPPPCGFYIVRPAEQQA